MPIVQVAVIVVAALVGVVILLPIALGLTFGLVGLVLTLALAGLIGWLADRIVPGELPFGWAGAVGAGILGAAVGAIIPGVNQIGPALFGIRLVPALVGAVIITVLVEIFWSRRDAAERVK